MVTLRRNVRQILATRLLIVRRCLSSACGEAVEIMLKYAKWVDTWLIQIQDITELWELQPTYILSQAVYLIAAVVTLVHALKVGGRWPYFWLGTILHGLVSDNFWHILVPEYDNFWHSQAPVMFFGGRLPLHIIFLYPAFIYHAAYAVSRIRLPDYAEPFAVGLVTVLIDIPYDIVAVKFVHWTWHDTDPNIYDRHYWVPWNSYYFHATFAASFFYFFHTSRNWPELKKWEAAERKFVEWKSVIVASLFGMPGGVMMFVFIYHPLHDFYKIHSEVTFFLLFAIFSVIVIVGSFDKRDLVAQQMLTTVDYVLVGQLALHYAFYWMLVVFFKPENEKSDGFHEPVGPCYVPYTVVTVFGHKLNKRKFFCPDDYDEGYFDFKCVGDVKPVDGDNWYMICGTPFENRAEYITILTTILIVAGSVFYCLYFKTDPINRNGHAAVKKKKQ